MPTDEPACGSAGQWLWFVLIWAAGVAVFGVTTWVLRSLFFAGLGG